MKNFSLPFDPTKEIFQWGPVPGKFFYTSVFSVANFDKVARRFPGEIWSKSLYLFRNETMMYLCDLADLQLSGESMFVHHMLPAEKRSELYDEWVGIVGRMNKISDEIRKIDLKSCHDKQLLEFWNKFHEVYMHFWVIGMVPELANYGSVQYLEKKLQAEIEDHARIMCSMEVLTAPEKLSFYQEEEIELLGTENIVEHTNKYFWLKNSYNGTEVLNTTFFENRKKELGQAQINANVERVLGALQKKIALQSEYKFSSKIMDIARAVSNGIEWQDERKKYILRALHTQTLFLEEISRRCDYEIIDLYNCWYFEIPEILSGKDFHDELAKRRIGFGVEYYDYHKNLYAKEVDYFWNTYLHGGKSQDGASSVEGVVVSKSGTSKSVGCVRILFDPHDLGSFQDGEILVAPMTSPEYVFVMKKASAVVTDVGGLTSHAAIVSRELGIPCIVGTKNATTVFKDGDSVEVDTECGVVKKI